MDKIDEWLDDINIMIEVRLSDKDANREIFLEELKILRQKFEQKNEFIDKKDLITLIADLDFRINQYIKYNMVIPPSVSNLESLDSEKEFGDNDYDSSLERYILIIEALRNLQIDDRVNMLITIQSELKSKELFLQTLQDKIAEEQYICMVDLIELITRMNRYGMERSKYHQLKDEIIKTIDRDTKLYIIRKLKTNLPSLIQSGKVDLADEIRRYIDGLSNLSEKTDEFWKKIILPLEKIKKDNNRTTEVTTKKSRIIGNKDDDEILKIREDQSKRAEKIKVFENKVKEKEAEIEQKKQSGNKPTSEELHVIENYKNAIKHLKEMVKLGKEILKKEKYLIKNGDNKELESLKKEIEELKQKIQVLDSEETKLERIIEKQERIIEEQERIIKQKDREQKEQELIVKHSIETIKEEIERLKKIQRKKIERMRQEKNKIKREKKEIEEKQVEGQTDTQDDTNKLKSITAEFNNILNKIQIEEEYLKRIEEMEKKIRVLTSNDIGKLRFWN